MTELFAPAMILPRDARQALQAGRHRRDYPDLVVHLVFDDLSEHRLGPDTTIGRSLGHLAGWLVETLSLRCTARRTVRLRDRARRWG